MYIVKLQKNSLVRCCYHKDTFKIKMFKKNIRSYVRTLVYLCFSTRHFKLL